MITGREGVASGKDCNNWKQSWRRGECRPGGTPGCQASFHRRSSGADGEWVGGQEGMLFVPQMSEFLSWGKEDRMDNFASARNRELQRNTHMVAGKSRDALHKEKGWPELYHCGKDDVTALHTVSRSDAGVAS